MSKAITISYQWNKALAMQMSKLLYDYDMRHSAKRYIGWFFVALVQFGIVGALKHESYGMLYLSTFLVLYWYYGRWYLRKRVLLSYYNKNIPHNSEVYFMIDEAGLHKEQHVIFWDAISKIIKLKEGILVQSNKDTLFFPNSAFASEEHKKRLLTLAKEKGKF